MTVPCMARKQGQLTLRVARESDSLGMAFDAQGARMIRCRAERGLSPNPEIRRMMSSVKRCTAIVMIAFATILSAAPAVGGDTRSTEIYKRIKARIDAVPAIDTHDHLWPFAQ